MFSPNGFSFSFMNLSDSMSYHITFDAFDLSCFVIKKNQIKKTVIFTQNEEIN